jgi:leucine-rich repeat protein SHOC2
LNLTGNQLTSLPAEIGRLTSLKELCLGGNKLTSLPAEIGRLTSLKELDLRYNHHMTSVPAEIGRLRELGCELTLDDGVTIEGENFSTYAGSSSASDSSDYSDTDSDKHY